jgi:hypothetical protein
MQPSKQRFFAAIAIAAGVITALLLAEVTLRIANIGYGNAPLESHPILHHVHPSNYEYLSYSSGHEYGSFTIAYDKNGSRVHRVPRSPQQQPSRFRVAFMGDSFVEATQVSDADSFVGRLIQTATPETDVANFGVSSYSPIYYVLQWRHVVREWSPTHVFLLLYSNDIDGDNDTTTKATFGPNGEVLAIPGPGNDWFVRLARESYLLRFLRMSQIRIAWFFDDGKAPGQTDGQFFEPNPEMTERSASYLRQLAGEVRASGGELVLMAVPSKARLKFPDKSSPSRQFADVIRDWAQKNEIKYVDLLTPFRAAGEAGKSVFFDEDIHFNPLGHAVVADTIRAAFPHLFLARELETADAQAR